MIVSDTDDFEDGTLCTTIMTGAPDVTLQCDTPIVGRYVTLQRDAAGHESHIINICEVEIEGEPGEAYLFVKSNIQTYYVLLAEQ